MSALSIQAETLVPAWHSLQTASHVGIYPIRNEAHYEQMQALMNDLLALVGDDEGHELANFLDLIGQLIEDYEKERYAIANAAPHEVLRFLMDQHGLHQTDLAREVGGQPVVSDILNGKRSINVRQAKALASRFGVAASAFL